MREPDTLALHGEHIRLRGLDQGSFTVTLCGDGRGDRRNRRTRQRSSGQDRLSRGRGKRRDPRRHQLLHRFRNRQRVVNVAIPCSARKRARDLQREERIATRSSDQANEQPTRKRHTEPIPNQVIQRRNRQRPRDNPLQAILRQRTAEGKRQVGPSLHASRQHQPRLWRETAGCELKYARRRRIEPLRIVDRNHQRPLGGKRSEHPDERRCDRLRIRRRLRLYAHQRHPQRPLLR